MYVYIGNVYLYDIIILYIHIYTVKEVNRRKAN